jgi:branched-chain amino acid transport system ATP-binding protein
MSSVEGIADRPEESAVGIMSATDVTVTFGGLVALSNVSVELKPRSIVGLVGPNGAGKSTLFNVISGFLTPRSGAVTLGGKNLAGIGPTRRARLGLARTFQHPEVFADLTIREHLVLAERVSASPRRLWTDLISAAGLREGRPKYSDRVEALLSSLYLAAEADRPAAGLPLGVARRVELARALMTQPTVLLLDEPSSGLDNRETEQLAEVLSAAVEEFSVSMLLVEHDVSLVLDLSSRVYVLNFGQMIAHGTPEEIRSNQAVRDAYLGDDPSSVVTEDNVDASVDAS